MENNLVEIVGEKYAVIQDMVYATERNMLGFAFYKTDRCFLHPAAAVALQQAIKIAAMAGLKIKIFDAYRCPDDHKKLWEFLPDPDYVADISKGSNHSRGVALDVTLVDQRGYELNMGTSFDAMTEESSHFHFGHSVDVQRNRLLLFGIMRAAGFRNVKTEWWHYELPDAENYPVVRM